MRSSGSCSALRLTQAVFIPNCLRRADVVFESKGGVQHPGRIATDFPSAYLEHLGGRLVGADILGHDHLVERYLDLLDRMGDDILVGIGNDRQLETGSAGALQRRYGVMKCLDRAHGRGHGWPEGVVPLVAHRQHPGADAFAENLLVILVRPLDELELNLFPMLPQLRAGRGFGRIAQADRVAERAKRRPPSRPACRSSRK